jgi:hypothetical protein
MDLPQWVCPIMLMSITSRSCRGKEIYEGESLYSLYATDNGLLSSKNFLEPQPTHAHYPS